MAASGARIDELSAREKEVEEELLKDMMVIRISLILQYLLEKMTVKTLRLKNSESRLFLDFEIRITQKSWKTLMELIWTVPEELQETDFII